MADLPRAVHFVSEAPQLDAKGLLKAIFTAQICIVGIGVQVAVFHELAGLIRASGAQIDRHHDIGIGTLRPFLEFVDAHLVGLDGAPGQFQLARSLFLGTGTVFPVVAGHKIAAGITHDGNIQFLDQIQHILAKAHIVGGFLPGLVDAAVNRASQMLDKGAVETVIDL